MTNIYDLIYFFDFFIFNILVFPIYQKFHPLIYRILLIIFRVLLVIKLNVIFNLFWYSYILYLLIVGGIIILILYLTRISNNELFNLEIFNYKNICLKFILIFFILYLFKNNLFEIFSLNLRLDLNNLIKMLFKDLYDSRIELFYMKFNIIIYIIIYLFILIIIAVLICTIILIPLRHLKN